MIGGTSLAELNASDGAFVRVISAKTYDFDFESGDHRLQRTERLGLKRSQRIRDGTRRPERRAHCGVVRLHIKAVSKMAPDMFYSTLNMAISGSRVLVSDLTVTGNQIIELNAISGSVIRVFKAGNGPWRNTRGILAADGDQVWITGSTYGQLVELDSRTGSVRRVIKHKVPVVGYVTPG